MNQKNKIIAIVGPSSTGKSDLSVKIAKKFGAEIISADSRYIYKEINIAAAKPSMEEMCCVPHHLIDICSVNDEYSVGQFIKDADILINNIAGRNMLPIVTGGTGLYFRSLCGTFDIPEVPADKHFRAEAENIPNEVLYSELTLKNPSLAKKIHPNNKVKIVRALEITRSGAEMKSKECPYNILWIGLNAKNRDFLYAKADLRVNKMFELGLFDEAKYLFSKYGKNNILMNTIGVKEFYDVIYNSGSLETAKEEIKKNTRHYIKKQISWFKNEKDVNWFYIDEDECSLIEKVSNLIKKFIE